MTVTMSMSPDFHYDYDDGYGGNSTGPCEWIHRQCTKPYIAYGLIKQVWPGYSLEILWTYRRADKQEG